MRAICEPSCTNASFLNVKIAVLWQDRKYQTAVYAINNTHSALFLTQITSE